MLAKTRDVATDQSGCVLRAGLCWLGHLVICQLADHRLCDFTSWQESADQKPKAMSESGPFEQADMASDGSYLTSPSAKRARFDDSANVDEVAQVTTVAEKGHPMRCRSDRGGHRSVHTRHRAVHTRSCTDHYPPVYCRFAHAYWYTFHLTHVRFGRARATA